MKEFWLPLVVSCAWTVFKLWSDKASFSAASAIGAFGAGFFFTSWLTGQFFRVRKQADVETRLESIVTRLERLTQDYLGETKGEGSKVRVHAVSDRPPTFFFRLLNDSPYPAFDIRVRIFQVVGSPMDRRQQGAHIPALYPSQVVDIFGFDASVSDVAIYKAECSTRTQGWWQHFCFCKKADGHIVVASITEFLGEVIEVNVPKDFPNYDPNDLEATFGFLMRNRSVRTSLGDAGPKARG